MGSSEADDVFTISLHQQNNYPEFKPPSSLDMNLPDEIGDGEYLACLGDALSMGLSKFKPDLICYLAGADPYREDQLGGLSLTIEGLKERDALVFRTAKAERHPRDGYTRRRIRPEARRHDHDSLQHGGGGEGSVWREGLTERFDILDAMDVIPSQLAHREFYNILISAVGPRPIAWVSSLSASGQPNLAPFSFFNAVCAKPPLLAFAPGMRLPKKSEAAAGAPAGAPAGRT